MNEVLDAVKRVDAKLVRLAATREPEKCKKIASSGGCNDHPDYKAMCPTSCADVVGLKKEIEALELENQILTGYEKCIQEKHRDSFGQRMFG